MVQIGIKKETVLQLDMVYIMETNSGPSILPRIKNRFLLLSMAHIILRMELTTSPHVMIVVNKFGERHFRFPNSLLIKIPINITKDFSKRELVLTMDSQVKIMEMHGTSEEQMKISRLITRHLDLKNH